MKATLKQQLEAFMPVMYALLFVGMFSGLIGVAGIPKWYPNFWTQTFPAPIKSVAVFVGESIFYLVQATPPVVYTGIGIVLIVLLLVVIAKQVGDFRLRRVISRDEQLGVQTPQ